MAVLGCSGERGEERGGSEGRGRRRDREGERGGEWEAGAWRPYPLLDAGEGVRWRRALVPTRVGGTGKGTRQGSEAGCGQLGQVGRPAYELGRLVQGGFPFLFFL